MKIAASDVRVGHLISHEGKLWRVLKKNLVKPGKGGAFAQLELKEISQGTKLNERFRTEDKLEKAHVEPRKMQYLYPEGDTFVFMDLESYEQLSIASEDLSEQAQYLQPNIEVQVNFHDDTPIGLELPPNVVMKVVETEAAIKGQTAAGGGKPAILESGLRVTIPTFVNEGEYVKVNTESGEYVERADGPDEA